MIILRDEKRIQRLKKIGQYVSFLGMGVLLVGLALIFWGNENAILYQLIALGVGWAISQIGIYLGHRYSRTPRPDEVLDDALKHVSRDGRLYHYLLPAPHVLLLPTGVIILHSKYQSGEITADGDSWKQKGAGLRKYFGQEGLGNPTKEVERLVSAMANYIRKNAPELEEVPMAPMIVFTTKNIKNLDVKKSNIPAMHASKVKGFLRQKINSLPPMPEDEYGALRSAFDKKAAHLLEERDGDPT
ncbi:MAG: nuclease-related domain-containing protein [Candidatus Promineifilaceae bacterium]|nr:nuclease-related domain-containing protein [Candidatus Promineifilaceae bacterium]